MAGDRGDVDDRTLALRPAPGQRRAPGSAARKSSVETPLPIFEVAIEATEPLLSRGFWRHSGIVDERVQRAVEKTLRLGDEVLEVRGIAEIGGDVMGPVRVAFAFLAARRHASR